MWSGGRQRSTWPQLALRTATRYTCTSQVIMSDDRIEKTNEQWRAQLDSMCFHVTREGGTEHAFSGKYWDTKTGGTYRCACCQQPLFASDTKYESGSGWPSYWAPHANAQITEHRDHGLGMERVEVRCGRCDAHLGHVFPDGPAPTGQRYCINSAALELDVGQGDG